MGSLWDRILECPREAHLVHFYGSDKRGLVRNVSKYIRDGLRVGESALMVATAEHAALFLGELDESSRSKVRCLDAHQTLAKFMVEGMPDWELFRVAIGPEIQIARQKCRAGVVRAYGEMVGVLWEAGRFAAAIRLEQFWNRLFTRSHFNLFCSYPIDISSKAFHAGAVDGVLCNHTHVVPAQSDRNFEEFVMHAAQSVLGGQAYSALERQHNPAWALMPKHEAMMLSLRAHAPEQADEILHLAQRNFREACSGSGILV